MTLLFKFHKVNESKLQSSLQFTWKRNFKYLYTFKELKHILACCPSWCIMFVSRDIFQLPIKTELSYFPSQHRKHGAPSWKGHWWGGEQDITTTIHDIPTSRWSGIEPPCTLEQKTKMADRIWWLGAGLQVFCWHFYACYCCLTSVIQTTFDISITPSGKSSDWWVHW